ncbi:MAG: ABC transporter permease [Anaerolineaceae bacterium]
MTTYIIRRILMVIPVLLGVSLLTFGIAKLTPGDPAHLMLGNYATPARIAELHEKLHLDDPVLVQFGRFVWNAMHGDFGTSYRGQKDVLTSIMSRFPSTAELALTGTIIAMFTGIPLGMLAAWKHGTFFDRAIMVLSISVLSIPVFWLAILLLYVFGVWLGWVSVTNSQGFSALILPAACLALSPSATLIRMTRSSILETLTEDYVRTARSKGLKEQMVMARHVLRNAMIPIITLLGLMVGGLLTGAVFIESVFARSGLGRFIIQAIAARDYPEVQGSVLFTATVIVTLNLLVDLLYAVIDPRIRYV